MVHDPDDERERFEERAAILEYCANLPRAEAEAAASASLHRGPRFDPITERQARGAGQEQPLKPCAKSALNEMRRLLERGIK